MQNDVFFAQMPPLIVVDIHYMPFNERVRGPTCWANNEGDQKMASKPMTKAQLVAALADETGMDKKAASGALDGIVAIITNEVSGGGAVTLPGVGKIYCRERPERMVRNPATGEQIKKEADKVVKMTIAKALKDSVND